MKAQPFASQKPVLVPKAANKGSEPDPVIVILCSERTQRAECGKSEKLIAVEQRKNLPFRDLTRSRIKIASVQNLIK